MVCISAGLRSRFTNAPTASEESAFIGALIALLTNYKRNERGISAGIGFKNYRFSLRVP
jgi:hypothetical protein